MFKNPDQKGYGKRKVTITGKDSRIFTLPKDMCLEGDINGGEYFHVYRNKNTGIISLVPVNGSERTNS